MVECLFTCLLNILVIREKKEMKTITLPPVLPYLCTNFRTE